MKLMVEEIEDESTYYVITSDYKGYSLIERFPETYEKLFFTLHNEEDHGRECYLLDSETGQLLKKVFRKNDIFPARDFDYTKPILDVFGYNPYSENKKYVKISGNKFVSV